MPRVDMTCVLLGRDGAIWGGTNEGVWRHYNGRFNYFWGKRWLVDNKVTGLSETQDGKIVVHTSKGSSTLWQDHVALSVLADHFGVQSGRRALLDGATGAGERVGGRHVADRLNGKPMREIGVVQGMQRCIHAALTRRMHAVEMAEPDRTPRLVEGRDRIKPIAEALHAEAHPPEPEDGQPVEPPVIADPIAAFRAFEAWYEAERGEPFLQVFDRYVPPTPVVEF